jgi:Fe2+ or Zn2+ uptake regulation protein
VEEMNRAHNFRCEKCNKIVTLETASRDAASSIIRKNGWRLRIGYFQGMVVGLWTCPEC